MRLAVYTNDSLQNGGGSFAVLVPTGELSFDATIAKDIPTGSKVKVVDMSVPSEKAEIEKVFESNSGNVSYFSAWTANFDELSDPILFTINMEKAKECHIDYIRKFRNKELSKLDVDYQRADETSDVDLKATIAAKKQKLRDMPSDARIVNCSDFDTLKTLTYEFLRDN